MIRYFFSMKPSKEDVCGIVSTQLPRDVELKKTRTGEIWISSSIVTVSVSDLDLSEVSAQFESFAKSVSEMAPAKALGISFWLDFEKPADAHGLHFSSDFLTAIAVWRPSVDVSINIPERQ